MTTTKTTVTMSVPHLVGHRGFDCPRRGPLRTHLRLALRNPLADFRLIDPVRACLEPLIRNLFAFERLSWWAMSRGCDSV
jgi:hypothetical protein